MIVHQTFLGHYTDRGGLWKAECTVGGQHFEATSRHSAPHELARKLLAAGLPDDEMIIETDGLKGVATCASFYAMARYTYREGDRVLARVKWKPPPAAAGGDGKEQEFVSEKAHTVGMFSLVFGATPGAKERAAQRPP